MNTSYDPDVEYVDGVLVERNVGELLHSWTQSNLIVSFLKYPKIYAVSGLRSKTRETRVLHEVKGDIVHTNDPASNSRATRSSAASTYQLFSQTRTIG